MTETRVAVFRDELLPLSQTFVANQTDALPADVLVVGSSRTEPALGLDSTSWCLTDEVGSLRAAGRLAAYKLTRRAPAMAAVLTAFGPDLLLAHFAPDGYRVQKVADRLDLPLVVHTHGSDVLVGDSAARSSHLGARRLARHWPDLVAGAACFVAPSEFVASALRLRGVPDAKVLTHHIGVPIPRLDVPEARHRHQQSRTLLFVGRLEENKGCRLLIEAVSRLGCADWQLEVIGDGSQRAALETQVRRAGLDDRVRFRGRQSAQEVASAMDSARLSVVPSVQVASGASEGFGLVILEAMARALPVVAFDTGGIAESGVGEHGVLVPPGDVGGLAGLLAELLGDDGRIAELGESGRRHVEQHFDVTVQAATLLAELVRRTGGA